MGYLERYIAEENAADYKAGHMAYGELLRRLTLLTGSAIAALALAVTLGCTSDSASSTALPPATSAAAIAPATSAPTALAPTSFPPTSAPVSSTATSAPPTTVAPAVTPAGQIAGITVSPNDPTIIAGDVRFQSGSVTLLGYQARPATAGPHPAVLVIHENRGLVAPHFADVARRLAKEGYVALALDLVSREGGTASFTDPAQASAALGRASQQRLVEDMNGGVRYLQSLGYVRADRIGAMGFCFGGGMVWLLSTQNPDIKAAAPFYGPAPAAADVGKIQAAMLGVYGGTDTRINAGMPALERSLKENNKTYKMNTYPGAGHAFFNNTGRAYSATAADAAWHDTLAWFGQYLKA